MSVLEKSFDIVTGTECCVLTTIDGNGMPNSRALLNLANPGMYPGLADFISERKDSLSVYFSTNTSSQKIQHIRECPKVSAYYFLTNPYRGVMLQGNIKIIGDREVKDRLWQDDWTLYYPEGRLDPDYSVLSLSPSYVKYYCGLHTEEYVFEDR